MRNESYTYAPCAVKVRYSLHVTVRNVWVKLQKTKRIFSMVANTIT